MPSKTVPKELNYYHKTLHRSTRRFDCPHCNISVLPKHFENHCFSNHDINIKICCVWCREKTWPVGKKRENANHLIRCYRNFLISTSSTKETIRYRLLSLKHAYPEKDFFNHILASPDPLTEFLSDMHLGWPLDVHPPPITFPDENLNLAIAYVRKYLETKNTHDWFHAMIKVVAFESFARAMDEEGGSSRTLEFSCWCDGGPYEQARHRQHRHMILVSYPKGHFKRNVWPKVKVSQENKPLVSNFPCKLLRHFKSPMHFINTLGYLSHRESGCNFANDETKHPVQSNGSMNHFYLYKTLPESFLLPLALQWDNGIYSLLYQTKFRNISIPRLVEHPLIQNGGHWEQKIKHFYGLECGLILPVAKIFVPTDQPTPYFFHLIQGKKLYFEKCALDDETWLRKQIQGGNCFYEIVGEHLWRPRDRDQKILNFHMPVLERCQKVEAENAHLKRKLEKVEKEKDTLKKKNKQLNSLLKKFHS